MACHYLLLKDQQEFFSKIKERDPEIVLKMVKCVLSAVKRKRDNIDIFDITFKDTTNMIFSIEKSEYVKMLDRCMEDMINIEAYEICSDIKKILSRKTRKSSKKHNQKTS
jgi:hypothetical protein